jgi:hypothetical protein
VFDSNPGAVLIWETRDVSRRPDVRVARLQLVVDDYPVVDVEAGLLGQVDSRDHSDSYDDDLGGDHRSIVEHHPSRRDLGGLSTGMKYHPVLFMQAADKAPEGFSQRPGEGNQVGFDHGHSQSPMAKRGGHLQSDETCSDDRGIFGVWESGDDSATVLERPQVVDVRQVAALNREASWRGTRG